MSGIRGKPGKPGKPGELFQTLEILRMRILYTFHFKFPRWQGTEKVDNIKFAGEFQTQQEFTAFAVKEMTRDKSISWVEQETFWEF